MATLGSISEGSIIKLKENGALAEFYVAKHNYESGLNGSGRTLVVRKDCYSMSGTWQNSTNAYAGSGMDSLLNGTYKNLLDSDIRTAMGTTKFYYTPGNGNDTKANLSRSVFVLSATEMGGSHAFMNAEGTALSGAVINLLKVAKWNGTAVICWTRSPVTGSINRAWGLNSSGNSNTYTSTSAYGVRPAFTLPSSLLVSINGPVYANTAPSTPSSISVPSSISGGSTINVGWGASTDAEGNLAGYIVERSTNGGSSWSQIYKGSSQSTTNYVAAGTTSIMFRVKAYDSEGLESGYKVSSQITVTNNAAPVISGNISNGNNIGLQNEGFSLTYTVTDADGDGVTVKEYLDNVLLRSYKAVLGQANTFQAVSSAHFQQILNGTHTIKVVANDGRADSAAYTVIFTKKITHASITLEQPLEADDVITVMVLNVAGSLPVDAILEVLVTNNAKDDVPVWEDATADVKNRTNYVFVNKTAERGFALNFRLTVDRGASDVGGYISSIGGAFE